MSGRTYTNPVYDGYLGDPFVLKHNGKYYAYGTVPLGELTVPVLHSRDLVAWRPLGKALTLRGDAFEALWAPEVAYDNGTFYCTTRRAERGARATSCAWPSPLIRPDLSRTAVPC